MKKRGGAKRTVLLVVLGAGSIASYYVARARATDLVLTGIVTTQDVIVSPLVTGPLSKLLVNEGDTVKRDQLLAVLSPGELKADRDLLRASNAEGFCGPGAGGRGDPPLPASGRPSSRSGRPKRRWPPAVAQRAEARPTSRTRQQQVAHRVARDARRRHTAGGRYRDAPTSRSPRRAPMRPTSRSTRSTPRWRWRARTPSRSRSSAAPLGAAAAAAGRAAAQAEKADVRLGLHRNPRADRRHRRRARGPRRAKSSSAGQPIVTLINPGRSLGARRRRGDATSIAVRIGDTLTVRLPSGEERAGDGLLPRRRRRLRHAARRQPHQARHQDLRDPPARGQPRSPARRGHDRLRAAAAT